VCKLRSFERNIAQASELSFKFVFHTQNCAVHSVNPTVSSVYPPTPRWYHLKALSISSHDIFLFKYHLLYHILRFLNFFSVNIMADVASKQQTTALLLSTSHTHKKTHRTDKKKKTDKTDGKSVLCQRAFSSVFRAVFLHS
jgi:hypothetical protein